MKNVDFLHIYEYEKNTWKKIVFIKNPVTLYYSLEYGRKSTKIHNLRYSRK